MMTETTLLLPVLGPSTGVFVGVVGALVGGGLTLLDLRRRTQVRMVRRFVIRAMGFGVATLAGVSGLMIAGGSVWLAGVTAGLFLTGLGHAMTRLAHRLEG